MGTNFPIDVSVGAPRGSGPRPDLALAAIFAEGKVGWAQWKRKLYLAVKFSGRSVGFLKYELSYPARLKWGGCDVSVQTRRFPFVENLNVGSVKVEGAADRALIGRVWFYETKRVEFQDEAELAVFGMGWGAFILMRTAGLIPGRKTKTAAARKGIEWLEEYRAWRAAGSPSGAIRPESRKETKDAGGNGDPGRVGLQEDGGGPGGGDGGEDPGGPVVDQNRAEGARLQGDGAGDQGRDGRAGSCTPRRPKTGARRRSKPSSGRRRTGSRS
jgi:hypothetical protein